MRDKHIEGAKLRHSLLSEAIRIPKQAPLWLASACYTQSTLALAEVEKEISPMALNTLKDAADIGIENGGWEELDRLRIQYKKFVAKENTEVIPSPVRTKTRKEIDDERNIESNQRDAEHRIRLRLGTAYLDLLRLAHKFAKDDSSKLQRLMRHQAAFNIQVGMQLISDKAENNNK